MDITASAKYVRISPEKMVLIAREIRGMQATHALVHLRAMNKKGARLVADVVQSAAANAKNNARLDADSLKVKSVSVTKGLLMKRFRPAARGTAHSYAKKTSHITVALTEDSSIASKQKGKKKNGKKS